MVSPIAVGVARFIARRAALAAVGHVGRRVMQRGGSVAYGPATPSGPALLTAEIFAIHRGRFAVVPQRSSDSAAAPYPPATVVVPSRQPVEVAVEEARRVTGLEPTGVRPLRVWTYIPPRQSRVIHATYLGWLDDDEVALSALAGEHQVSWVSPDEYIDRWFRPEHERLVPAYAEWIAQVRYNCQLVAEQLAG